MKSVTIKTPSRLHFGLLGWGPHSFRQFGGFGLMVDDPGIELSIEPSETWEAFGDHAGRCLDIARQIEIHDRTIQPSHIKINHVPREHVGLGVGTQLSLAVARGLTTLYGNENLSSVELAKLTGRGHRSGVGIHGFSRGGLIVDAGRRGASDVPTLINALDFPTEWSILLVTPTDDQGLHGKAEVGAFQKLEEMPLAITERVCRLLLLQVLPAILEKDLESFGEGLSRIQHAVGEIFSPIQGGAYASAQTENWIKAMKVCGLTGVGQSSWGPTLYGFTADVRRSSHDSIVNDLRNRPGSESMKFLWTAANQGGATLSRDS